MDRTYSGVSVFDINDHWVANYRKSDGLFNNYVQDICFDTLGIPWIGVYADYLQEGGITRFVHSACVSYSVAQGLADNTVKRMTFDKSGYLWITTGNGVSRLNSITGIDDKEPACKYQVFPNPAKDVLYIPMAILPLP